MSFEPDPSYLPMSSTSLFAVKTTATGTPDSVGSRRRKLWEMCGAAQCPVVGICLPMPLVKKLAAKYLLHTQSRASDYETHCAFVVACKSKSALSKVIQEQLDLRFHNELRAVQSLKTREALLAYWHAHMMQHQAGCERQTEANEKIALKEQLNATLTANRKLEEKYHALQINHAQTQQRQQDTLFALQTELASQHGEITKLKKAIDEQQHTNKAHSNPGTDVVDVLRTRINTLKSVHLAELSKLQSQVKNLEAQLAKRPATFAIQSLDEPSTNCNQHCKQSLNKRCVLCVGGRPSAVPLYRQTVEKHGGTFIHHDGGQEEGIVQLDAKLKSADLVICQAGCVSHEAYFRVKEHCKKRGIQCVYVKNPSKSALKKALQWIAYLPC